MDDILIPPSAFINRTVPMNNFKSEPNAQNFISVYEHHICQKINKTCQTECPKIVNSGTCTTEQIFTVEDFRGKITSKKVKYLEKVETTKKQCSEEVSKVLKQSEEMHRKLLDVTRDKDVLAEELSKLKLYIGGIEDRDAWMKEKQRLSAEIESLQYTLSDQQSLIDSLNIQMSSMEKIQCIQEKELHKSSANIHCTQISQKEPNYEILLRAWRHKVLSLLVQQESVNIVNIKEKHCFRTEIHDLVNDINHLQTLLEQLNLKFDVQQAQLSTNDVLVEKYKRENDNLHRKLETITRQLEDKNGQFEHVSHQLNSFCRVIDEEVFVKFEMAGSKLDTFHRRLDYANSRFSMIQANFKRQRNMTEHKETGERMEVDLPNAINVNKMRQLEEALVITNNELKTLRQERDRLIATMDEDSATFFDRLKQKKDELKDEMEHLRSMACKYEHSLSKVSKDLELVKQENYRLKGDYDSLLSAKHAEAEILHTSLKECRSELSRVNHEFSELKRSAAQGKKQMEEMVVGAEQRLIQCDNQWKKTCDQLSAERDLLKMTIRQEGILSKFKTKTNDRKSVKDKSLEKQVLDAENIMKEVNELAEELNIDPNRWD